jgi:hypothetical protein
MLKDCLFFFLSLTFSFLYKQIKICLICFAFSFLNKYIYIKQIRKVLKSKFRELSFSLTINGGNRNTYENRVKTIEKIIDKAFRIIKSNNNEKIDQK